MDFPKDRKLFTINEFSNACGVSRTTLIRIEECGVLTPCFVNPETGYRYYDAYNASQVGQYLLLQSLGLSRKEISDCYYQKENSRIILKEQCEKLSRMQRILEELELRNGETSRIRFSYTDFSEITCYCVSSDLSSAEEGENFFYKAHEQCIREGFRLHGTEPLFGTSTDDWRMHKGQPAKTHSITACIPVIPPDHSDPRLRVFPAVHAFSAIGYGDYSMVDKLTEAFWKEIEAQGIQPAGPARFIGLVAPYTGVHIAREKYCYRIMLPVHAL